MSNTTLETIQPLVAQKSFETLMDKGFSMEHLILRSDPEFLRRQWVSALT